MTQRFTTCRHCAFSIPPAAAVCPGCGRRAPGTTRCGLRRDRRRALAHAMRAGRRGAAFRASGYRSLVVRAQFARRALVLAMGASLAVWAVGLSAYLRDRPALTGTDGGIDFGDLESLAAVLVGVEVGVTCVAALAFMCWSVRAYRNLPALGIDDRRYWTGWLVVAWFLPGINLVVPRLLLNDLWRASSPSAPARAGSAAWQHRPVASLVVRWWIACLLTPTVYVVGFLAVREWSSDSATVDTVVVLTMVAANATLLLAAGSARSIVGIITVSQARRAEAVIDLRDPRPDADPRTAPAGPVTATDRDATPQPARPGGTLVEP